MDREEFQKLYHCTTWNNYKNNILKDKRLWKKT